MKNHGVFIAILLSLTLSTTAYAASDDSLASNTSFIGSSNNPPDGKFQPIAEVPVVAQTPTNEENDEDSASEEDKIKTPVGTITDEIPDDEDLKEDHTDKKEVEMPPVKSVIYKAFDYKEAEKIIPSKFRKEWEDAGLPKRAINNVLSFLLDKDSNLSKIDNERMVIIDFTKPSTEQRLFILNLKTGKFAKRLTTHGKKSGNLYATEFSKSNNKKSFQTTVGFHVIAETYSGKHGKSYRVDGLEERNIAARDRNVVIHGAMYATTDFIKIRRKHGGSVRLGLSLGCPAVSPNTMDLLLELKLSGALLYNYTTLDSNAKVLLNP
jgi:hypothetical protein